MEKPDKEGAFSPQSKVNACRTNSVVDTTYLVWAGPCSFLTSSQADTAE